jgi:hypothetical protein
MSGQCALIDVPPGLRSKPSRPFGAAKDDAAKRTSILTQRFDPDNHKLIDRGDGPSPTPILQNLSKAEASKRIDALQQLLKTPDR